MSLTQLKTGEKACIEKIIGGRRAKNRLSSLGFVRGKNIKIFRDNGGPIIIGINDDRIALGRGMASKVMVYKKGCDK